MWPSGEGGSANAAVRDTLFGDLPLDRWPSPDAAAAGYPWDAFVQARTRLAAGAVDDAKRCWREIAGHPGLESRHYLQAWHFLRERGEPVPENAKQVLGVVVEMGLPEGLDILAAYADGSARYYNYASGGVVLDNAQGSLAERIAALLAAASDVVEHIGPWEGLRPAPPPQGHARLSFLTPRGLHFGQGPLGVLEADPRAGVILRHATAVLTELTSRPSSD